MAKRAVDVLCSAIGLMILLPLFAVVAVAIKLTDGGPVFFRQTRVGLDGAPFTLLKFRSMKMDPISTGPGITVAGDRRVTKVGKFIRRTKIDETPQLWNVLVSEMSLVGPRPELPRYVNLYSEQQKCVLALKPGMTDEASLAFRNEEDLLAQSNSPEDFYITHCIPEKIRLNLAYAGRASVARDVMLILRTIATLTSGK